MISKSNETVVILRNSHKRNSINKFLLNGSSLGKVISIIESLGNY